MYTYIREYAGRVTVGDDHVTEHEEFAPIVAEVIVAVASVVNEEVA